MKPSTPQTLPLLIAGPILRKTTQQEIVIWIVTSQPLSGSVSLYHRDDEQAFFEADLTTQQSLQIGQSAWVSLIQLNGEFPTNTPLEYDILTDQGSLKELASHLTYNDRQRVEFVVSEESNYILHGSCRNPHHPSKDSLVAADAKLANQAPLERPDLLMMSGDQIYADHVAGPMLDAIWQVIQLLGLPDERLPNDAQVAAIQDSQSLFDSEYHLYQRHEYLPHHSQSYSLLDKLLPNRKIPIFSSRESENHLVTLSEFVAMYLLVWSPTLWQCINRERLIENNFEQGGRKLTPLEQQQWRDETVVINDFIEGLPQVQRLLAHIPTYMIFDDHDVTDDWNLTVGWEQAVLQNQLATQVIGNGLASYWLCQGWGNAPEKFDDVFIEHARSVFEVRSNDEAENRQPIIDEQAHQGFIEYLSRFEEWHYTIDLSPKVIVLDTRTRRWRSESRMNKPSGLMDWEALIEFQHQLMHQDKVIIVSAAPMFGVKFIEALQKIMTTCGQPLVIDAENWMAHPGSANTLISIFTHTKTPTNFVVLSGDVHYSFAYDIKLRYRKNSPNIYQITCSGIKNEFPAPLLKFCDVCDRLLYSPRSILNYFTKRKRLRIEKRSPDNQSFYRLSNRSAIGELKLDDSGKPISITTLSGDGKVTRFPEPD
ncbi:alkaline phosphatase family protein [Vibrio sp. D404a]|uniref:alkaline phosphatase family protein n=1 Tax=unclassified Vibrio TaxID=2614977 RepID=UPI0025530D90|nr:alkaline phosphatase family protein [Vibrio sp. D404a]MDK9799541.1 alkaline phosphatase family protein [Vibrio sp. D449a]